MVTLQLVCGIKFTVWLADVLNAAVSPKVVTSHLVPVKIRNVSSAAPYQLSGEDFMKLLEIPADGQSIKTIVVLATGIPLGAAPPPKGSFLPLFNPTLRLSEGIKLKCNHPPRT